MVTARTNDLEANRQDGDGLLGGTAAHGGQREPTRSPRRVCVILAVLCILCSGWLWGQRRALRSSQRVLAAQTASLERMQIDAERIENLLSKPQQAVDREKPNDELLAQIEAALQEAGVPRKLWQDSIPQPPQRDKDSDYLRLTTRLVFEGITMKRIAAFGNRLLVADPTLRLTSLRVHAGAKHSKAGEASSQWNVELAVAYFVYEPEPGGQ